MASSPVVAVLDDLLERPRTQAELVSRHFECRSGTASKALGVVESLGLIARPGGRMQPYIVTHPELTAELLVAAAELAHALSDAQARADAALLERRRARG